MNVTLTNIDEVTAKLTVAVEENDYQTKVAEELKKIGRNHVIPGFRKGHIPFNELKRRFGRQVTSDVINHEVYEAVVKYIQDNKLGILGEPMPMEVKELDLVNNKDFTFEYELGLAPEIKAELSKDITLPFYTIEVSEDMVKEQDKMYCERFGAQVPIEAYEGKALIKGSIMELNADGSINENEGAIQVVDGIVAPWRFTSDDEAAKFAGKKVGDKVAFNPYNTCNGNAVELASMLHVDREKAADIKADFELSISEIIGLKLAEHNEEFYKEVFGDKVTTEEEYFETLRKSIANQLLPNSSALFQNTASKFLTEKFGDFQLPAAFLKKWLMRQSNELTEANIDEEYTKMESSLKWQLIKERIAANTGVKISEEDLTNFAKHIAASQFAQYGMTNLDEETLNGYAKHILEDKEYRPRIVEQVGDAKLFEAISNAITVDNKTVSLEEFQKVASEN
jgi:trigger factor